MTALGAVRPSVAQTSEPGAARPAGRSLALLLIGIVALPLLLIGGAAWHGWTLAWRGAESELLRASEVAAEYLRRVLEGHDLRIQRVNDVIAGLTDAEITAQEARLHAALQRIAGREADGSGPLTLFVFDRDARMLVGATLHPVPRDQDFAGRDFNQALRDPQAPEPQVGRVHVGRLDGRAFFTVSRRRRESANPPGPEGYDGVVVASVYVDGANQTLQRLLREPEDVLSLVRTDGEVLARSAGFGPKGPPLRVAPGTIPHDVISRGEERSIIYGVSSLDGVRRLAVYRRVEGWPVYAAAARPEAAVRAAWWQAVAGELAVGLPAWALLVGLAGAVWRRQRALGEANATLERRVAARTQDLAESEAQLRLAQEAAGVGIWDLTAETGLNRWSPEQYAIFGLDPEREPRITLDRFLDLVHPDDRPLAEAAAREALRTGRYEAEFRILRPRPDGGAPELRWLLGRGRRVPGRQGQGVRLLGVNVDITDRHLAEERRALVAQEVAHRAKNALTLVGAAVRMTRATDTAEFIRLVEGRIAALARAQTLLAEAGGRGADLRALASGEVESVLVAEPGGPRLDLAGPGLTVAEDAVQPLSMALHELATNAVKYGALSRPEGRVSLSWGLDEEAGLLRLRWEERDGPPPAAPEREGFGSKVLEATLAGQLGGTLRRDWPASGLVLEALLPLALVAAEG
ncbi:PAS domain S-box protein [Dankookia rubra]|uniref:histidine kinase n=1 Tax=Dankookia rubra TaxID=1442381 RepID=A0A4R5Q9V3_9PROT|nr:HWE histidine kinase domain-containing protein [Dankookia rubra]TDH59536.1 PAS domain S-box protein [Dankookia rubra]